MEADSMFLGVLFIGPGIGFLYGSAWGCVAFGVGIFLIGVLCKK